MKWRCDTAAQAQAALARQAAASTAAQVLAQFAGVDRLLTFASSLVPVSWPGRRCRVRTELWFRVRPKALYLHLTWDSCKDRFVK